MALMGVEVEPWAVTVTSTATVTATAVVTSMYAPPRRAGLYDAKNDDGLVGLAVLVEAAAAGRRGCRLRACRRLLLLLILASATGASPPESSERTLTKPTSPWPTRDDVCGSCRSIGSYPRIKNSTRALEMR